jgi:hypothetical protein
MLVFFERKLQRCSLPKMESQGFHHDAAFWGRAPIGCDEGDFIVWVGLVGIGDMVGN